MSITVKNLIDKYSAIQEGVSDESPININLNSNELTEEETKILAALNIGVVTEKVLKERRESRNP